MKTYATYVRGEELDRPINGVLSVEDDGIRFETFPEQSPLAKILPLAAPAPDPKINWFYPRSAIKTLSDLQGRRVAPVGLVDRALHALQVEPNGLMMEISRGGAKIHVVFDCAVSVYRLIAAFESAARSSAP